jgi:hypothetical protein
MLKVPPALLKKYDRLLVNSDVPPLEYGSYKKWLRYYLDFCKKYQHEYTSSKSLHLFINKLKEKNQSNAQRSQAQKAVQLYYKGLADVQDKTVQNSVREGAPAFEITTHQESWKNSIEALKNEIEIRHYSEKTLKSYQLWAEKIQYHVSPKSPEMLTADDVKSFLTFLAVKKKVSASSQNQAFNALLFFFRHVLKKEFGKMEGVVRAKRKPYIPVVLSRTEIHRVIDNLTQLSQTKNIFNMLK